METTRKVATLAATLITFGSLVVEANAVTLTFSGNPSESTFSFSSLGGDTTATAGIATWITGYYRSAPLGISDAPRISSYSNSGDFVSGLLGAYGSGVFGSLGIPVDIVSDAGTSTIVGIVFDDDGVADDFHILLEQDDPTPSLTYTLPAFSTSVTFAEGTFGDLSEGTFALADGSAGNTLQIVTVPEPSSAFLFGLVALGFAARRRRY